jgi:hypothetical protein
MIKRILFVLGILISLSGYAQSAQKPWEYATMVKGLPVANNSATITGYPFSKELHISKDSLKRGFKLVLLDQTYKIDSFVLYYDCEDCDIWEKIIVGDTVRPDEVKILGRLKKGDLLECGAFKIKKKGKAYTVPSFYVIITD